MDTLWAAIGSNLIAALLGTVASKFVHFFPQREEFRKRIELQRQRLLEDHAAHHMLLLKHITSLTADETWRGDGVQSPDFIGNHSEKTYCLFANVFELSGLNRHYKVVHGLLLTLSVFSFVGAFLVVLLPQISTWAICVACASFTLQLGAIGFLYTTNSKLEDYEDVH